MASGGAPVEIRRQLALARSLLPFLVASAVLAGVATYVFASAQRPVYEARSILLVGELLTGLNPDYNQLLVSQRLSTTYAAIAGTRPVLEKVVAAVGLEDSPEALSRRVQVNTTADSSLLTIVARDEVLRAPPPSPMRSARSSSTRRLLFRVERQICFVTLNPTSRDAPRTD